MGAAVRRTQPGEWVRADRIGNIYLCSADDGGGWLCGTDNGGRGCAVLMMVGDGCAARIMAGGAVQC